MFEQIVFEKVTQRKGNNTIGDKLPKFQCDARSHNASKTLKGCSNDLVL